MTASARPLRLLPLVSLLALAAGLPAAAACPWPTFDAPQDLPLGGTRTQRLAIADLNGDGRPDLVAADSTWLRVSLNLGGGAFAPPREVAAGGEAFATADFDRDGHVDVALVRGASLIVLFGDGAGGIRDGRTVFVGTVVTPAAGDFDGDGAPDLAFVAGEAAVLTALPGDGRGGFRPPVESALYARAAVQLSAVDLDRDGRDDLLLVTHPFGTAAAAHFSNGDGSFRDGYGLGGGFKSFATVLASDVDGDGRPELVVPYSFEMYPFSVTVHFLDAGGRIARSVTTRTTGPWGLANSAVADFDGDGHADFAYADGSALTVMKGDGTGAFGRPVSFPASGFDALAAVDLDADGRLDVVTPGAWLRNTCGAGTARTLVVPVLLSSPGAAGALYETDLTITNAGDTTAHVALTYTPSAGGGGGSASTEIPPRSQLASRSAFDLLSALGIPVPASGTRIGTLRAEFSGLAFPHAAAIDVRVTSGGFGVAFPALEPPRAERQVVPWLKQDATDRSNLGLAHAGTAADGPVSLRVSVVSTDPAAPGFAVLPDLTLSPGEFRQIDGVLIASGLAREATSGYAAILRVAGSAPFLAWGVVNDQVSSDGSFVAARPVGTGLAPYIERLLPSVVESPAYITELHLTNTGSSPCDTALTFRSSAGDQSGVVVTVPANGSFRSDDVIDTLRRTGNGSIPPSGTTIAGVLRTSPGCAIAIGRVVTDLGAQGRAGVLLPELPDPRSPAPAAGFVPDLRQDGHVRTNLVLYNPAYSPMVARVEIFSAFGAIVAVRDVPLEGFEWLQVDRVLARWAPGLPRGWARVSSKTADHGITSYAVINDGAAPGLGTGDGSIVQMEPEP